MNKNEILNTTLHEMYYLLEELSKYYEAQSGKTPKKEGKKVTPQEMIRIAGSR